MQRFKSFVGSITQPHGFWQVPLAIALTLLLGLGMPAHSGQRQPVLAQSPLLEGLSSPFPDAFKPNPSANTVVNRWVRLDGRALFRVAAPSSEITLRVQDIQQSLRQIQRDYLQQDVPQLDVKIREQASLPTLYVNDHYIMTVTHLDAQLEGTQPMARAETLRRVLAEALVTSRQEHRPEFLLQQAQRAMIFAIAAALISLGLKIGQRRLHRWNRHRTLVSDSQESSAITTQLKQHRRRNVGAIQETLLQLTQIGLWGGTLLLILGLFPHTRALQVRFLNDLPTYLSLGLIGVASYLVIRLSYVVIDGVISTLIQGTRMISRPDTRMEQRVSTISRVTKGVTTLVLGAIAIILMLIHLGVDVGPLIAGAGLIGVAISLASQNLIKDAINGFLILVEDQYAVGDVISVGDVFGSVENMTLRITQLRDPEERLITIPNSEIRIVSNLSNRHAQADIKIPVSYRANIDQALDLAKKVCAEMRTDLNWRDRILSDPLVLGLDEFSDRGMMIRVWIRSQPLQQWSIAREYRRRIKTAFDQAGIELALVQQDVWLQDRVSLAPPHPEPPIPSDSSHTRSDSV